MKLSEDSDNHLIKEENEDYSQDNESLSFEVNNNIMNQNIRNDQLSFSITDDRKRYFFDGDENRNNSIESSENLNIEPKEVKFLNSINIFKENIPISSANEQIETSPKKETSTNSESFNKKEKKRKIKRKVDDQDISKKNKKKIHSGAADDNILRKIQIHFLSFIINYSNDIISSLTDEKLPRFKDLDYKQKKIVKHQFVEELKKKTIKEILEINITPKEKKSVKKNDKYNKYIYDTILKKCPSIDGFFNKNYLTLFKEYYYNIDDIFRYNEKIIPLSEKTKKKTFNSLILKHHKYIEKIKYVCNNYYLNTYKRMKKPNFKIQKSCISLRKKK